jgi:hypothetical protein
LETSSFTHQEKVQNVFNRRKLMLTVFGTLSRDGLNNEQRSLLCDELKPAIQANEEDYCQKA